MYRHFRIQVVLRVLLLAATLAAALGLALYTASYVAAGLVALVAAYEVAALVRYVERTNHDLARLLRSIRYSDFAQSFTGGGRGRAFSELADAFRAVMDDFRAARAEKEESYRYLETVMQHVGVGLLSFSPDGTVHLVNTAAKRLLRVPYLKNIHALADFSPALVETLLGLRYGDKALVRVNEGDDVLQLALHATEFKMRGARYTLVSLQDIQRELEEKETQAWQQLTRVLTHEIMNSVAPIASLASTARDLLDDEALPVPAAPAGDEALADVRGAVRTIERRSEGLLHFVQNYRRLTRVPTPDLQIFPAAELFETVTGLLAAEIAARGVHLDQRIVPETLDLTADPDLLEQVLINLIKNALDAVEGVAAPRLALSARIDGRGRAVIQVEDNGRGIVEEAMDQVFVPFFTTKPDGSGIGLSLSREILRQHGGTLTVRSTPGVRTVFTLRF